MLSRMFSRLQQPCIPVLGTTLTSRRTRPERSPLLAGSTPDALSGKPGPVAYFDRPLRGHNDTRAWTVLVLSCCVIVYSRRAEGGLPPCAGLEPRTAVKPSSTPSDVGSGSSRFEVHRTFTSGMRVGGCNTERALTCAHFQPIEVCDRTVLCGFRAHSSIPKYLRRQFCVSDTP